MNLPSDKTFGLTENNPINIEFLTAEVERLQDIIDKKNEDIAQASQTLMQLVTENFQLKDQNRALIAENEQVISDYNVCRGKLNKATKAGNMLIEIIEEMRE